MLLYRKCGVLWCVWGLQLVPSGAWGVHVFLSTYLFRSVPISVPNLVWGSQLALSGVS